MRNKQSLLILYYNRKFLFATVVDPDQIDAAIAMPAQKRRPVSQSGPDTIGEEVIFEFVVKEENESNYLL